MPYNSLVDRPSAAALIPEDYSHSILQHVIQESAALSLFRHVPMSRAQLRMPAESALPTAYFVSGDTGLKQTTQEAWANVFLNAEELAVIVPVPESVLDDVDFDLWGMIEPQVAESLGRALDAAVFFGTNIPASWPQAIVPAAVAAGNVAVAGTNTPAQGGVVGDMSDLMTAVEKDGYDVSAFIASRVLRGALRQARGTTGEQLAEGNGTDAEQAATQVYGVPITYPMRGMWPTAVSTARVIGGDFSRGMLGVRQDLTWKILDQAVITDTSTPPQVIFNLAQQDMVALRVVARFAFQVANPINYDQATPANRYPFGVLNAAATGGPLALNASDEPMSEESKSTRKAA
jgi:HK97 family phage major capsid protein